MTDVTVSAEAVAEVQPSGLAPEVLGRFPVIVDTLIIGS